MEPSMIACIKEIEEHEFKDEYKARLLSPISAWWVSDQFYKKSMGVQKWFTKEVDGMKLINRN